MIIKDFYQSRYKSRWFFFVLSLREFPKNCVTAYNPLTGE